MKSTHDNMIDAKIADAARRYAEDPEGFFFYATGLVLGISKEEVAERVKRIFEGSK